MKWKFVQGMKIINYSNNSLHVSYLFEMVEIIRYLNDANSKTFRLSTHFCVFRLADTTLLVSYTASVLCSRYAHCTLYT